MKRIVIKWDTINQIECSGTAVIDEWADNQTFVDYPATRTEIPVVVSKNSTSMKNIPHRIHEEFADEISAMMKTFFAGVCGENSTYKWLELKGK